MVVFPVLIAIILIVWSYFVISRWDFNKKMAHIPTPKGYWLLGNALDFPTRKHLLTTLIKYNDKFNGLLRICIGIDRGGLSVSRYSFIEKVLSSSTIISKSRDYQFLARWLEEGLLTSSGKKWQQRRKLLTPAFHFQILEPMVNVFNEASDVLVKKLKKEVGKASFDVYPYITLCTLDVIIQSSMGITMNVQENDESEYVKCVKTMSSIVINRAISPIKQQEWSYRFTDDYKQELKALQVLHSTTDSVIKTRRELIQKAGSLESFVDEFGKKKRLAFLDVLLTATIEGKPLNDKEIREEVDTFMFEGHDTTSSGVAFALFNLAKYPQFQERIYEEQVDIFAEDINRSINYKDLQEMKYLEMFIKESMRLYPPVPMFGRQLEGDTEIDGHVLPKDLDIGIFAYYVMRSESNFAKPDVFDPERFSAENKLKIKPYAYIPFSAGPRNCIGQKFAMMELKSVISKLVRSFKLVAVDNFEPDLSAEVILKSSNGIRIKLENRS